MYVINTRKFKKNVLYLQVLQPYFNLNFLKKMVIMQNNTIANN